jgi:hypothetical protein
MSWTFAERPTRRGAPDDARTLWIDETAAKRDGINVERLRAVYEPLGIKIVVGLPRTTRIGKVVCPGCDTAYDRDRECWRPCDLSEGGWRPICRVCENTEYTSDPRALDDRNRRYAADPGLRTRPGKGLGSPSWTNRNAKRKRRSNTLSGRFGS